MITYASIADYKQMKSISNNSGILNSSTETNEDNKIEQYLRRATRFIDRNTRRTFIPYIEEKEYEIPNSFFDLARRRFPSAHLKLDEDLLEGLNVNNGTEDLESGDYFFLEHNIYPKTLIAVKPENYWGGVYGGITGVIRYDQPIIKVEAVWGYADGRYPDDFWIDTNETCPTLTDSQTSISLTDVDAEDEWGDTRFTTNMMIRIDDEFMEVTEVDTGTDSITVVRGFRGSTAATHDSGTTIEKWRVIDDIVEATLQITKAWIEGDVQIGSRAGISDASANVDVGMVEDSLTIIKSYQRSLLFG